MKKITTAVKNTLAPEMKPSCIDDESEIIMQLKEKFQATNQRSEKVQILTVLPRSWSSQKVEQEFGVSNYMARKAKELVKQKGWSTRKVEQEFGVSNYMACKAKELVKQKGILSTPNPKHGHTLTGCFLNSQ